MRKNVVKNYKRSLYMLEAAGILLAGCSVSGRGGATEAAGGTVAESSVAEGTVKATSSEAVESASDRGLIEESTKEAVAETEGKTEEASEGQTGESTVKPDETSELVSDPLVTSDPEIETTEDILESTGELIWEGEVAYEPVGNLTAVVEKEEISADISDIDEKLLSGIKEFSERVFSKGAAKDIAEGKNVMMSSQSVLSAMGMVTLGAGGENEKELLKVLAGTETEEGFHEALLALSHLNQKSGDVLKQANSIWIKDKGYGMYSLIDNNVIRQDFLSKIRSYYNGDIFSGDLENAAFMVNDWVSEKTDKMIKELFDASKPIDAASILINAIAFDAQWQSVYEDFDVNENGEFTTAGGEKQKATMLSSKEDTYLSDDDTTGFLKYYQGCNYAFVGLLPAEGTDMSSYISEFSGDKLDNLLKNRQRNVDVYTMMPEFELDYSIDLNDVLKELGINLAFNENGADFSEMFTEEYANDFYVSGVLQKTHIEVTREGTKAAAVTAVTMAACESIEEPKQQYYVELDRPYVYAIIDTETNVPIFMGVVNSID